jgi:PAS domain S-box-containing protein
MASEDRASDDPVARRVVQGTELLPTDSPQLRRQKMARITLDSMVQFVALLDARGTVLEINQVALDAVGLRLSDVEGKPFWTTFWWQVSEPIQRLLRDSIARAASGESVRWDTEIYGRAPGQETILIDASLLPVRDQTGEVVFICAEGRDITAKKGLREAAESANRAKDEFLAILGHELRNPLSPILTALQLMKLRGDAGSERERTVIERQVNHLTRLVDDLLDVSRIARGNVQLKTGVVELSEIVARAIELASPLIEQRTHRLRVDMPRHGLRLEGDAARLSQVVANLLTNAAKFTPPGGEITVHGEQVAAELVLSVRDNGIGIAKEVLPRVFDVFVQAQQALDRAGGGLGIGLTIVRSLVEQHAGSVSAHSDGPGTGSEFVVRLPVAPSQLAGAGTRPPEARSIPAEAPSRASSSRQPARAGLPAPRSRALPESSARERILVVDDNEDGAEMLAEALQGMGYSTRIAHDAPAALSAAAEFSPQIAFLDIGLPVMDGYELASHLRALPGLADIQLIALTGYGQQEDKRRTRAAGFHHHLVKPVDMSVIEATLKARTSKP